MNWHVETKDEEGIYAGDNVTIKIKMIRTNLKEGELQGSVYSYKNPTVQQERWLLLVGIEDKNIVVFKKMFKENDKVQEAKFSL